MPRSIEDILNESKELIERSRELRARSLQETKRSADAMRRSDKLSHEAKEIVRHLVDSDRK